MAKNTVEVIIKARDQATKVLTTFQSKFKAGMTSLRKSIFSLKGAVIALAGAAGMGLLAKSLIGVASEVENFTLRLKFLMGSQEAAAKKMQFFQEVASKVPFGLKEIINAGVTLEAMGADSEKWIRPLIDMAAVMGVQLPVAAENLGRSLAAGMAASEIFREKGIRKMTEEFHGLNDITKLAVKEQGKLFYSFVTESKKIAGAADEMKDTWSGIVSMIGDSVFKIKQSIMEAGIFEAVKKVGTDIKKKTDEWMGDTERFTHDIGLLVLNLARSIGIAASMITKSMLAIKFAMTIPESIYMTMAKIAELDARMRAQLTPALTESLKAQRQELFMQANAYKEMYEEAKTAGAGTLELLNKIDAGLATSLASLETLIKEGYEEWANKTKEVKEEQEKLGNEIDTTTEKIEELTESFYELHGVSMFSTEQMYNFLESVHLTSLGLANIQPYLRQVREGVGDFGDDTEDASEKAGEAVKSIADQFIDMTLSAQESFKITLKAFVAMVNKMLIKAGLLRGISILFGLPLPTLPWGLTAKEGGGVMPAMQEGGAIVRTPTIVSPGVIAGEAGPEIIPLEKMKMMGETTINLQIISPFIEDRIYWENIVKKGINPAIKQVGYETTVTREVEL